MLDKNDPDMVVVIGKISSRTKYLAFAEALGFSNAGICKAGTEEVVDNDDEVTEESIRDLIYKLDRLLYDDKQAVVGIPNKVSYVNTILDSMINIVMLDIYKHDIKHNDYDPKDEFCIKLVYLDSLNIKKEEERVINKGGIKVTVHITRL